MTGRRPSLFGVFRTRHLPPKHTVPTPRQFENAEASVLKAAARICWATATGLLPEKWIGRTDPVVEPLIEAVRLALQDGATVSQHADWAVVTRATGGRLVVAASVLAEAIERCGI